MQINVLENKNNIKVSNNSADPKFFVGPIKDMHEIENWEDRLDHNEISYALVEFRKVTKHTDVFLGWAIFVDKIIEN